MSQQRLIHRCQLFWFPGEKRYEIRCVDCDMTMVDNPLAADTIFFIPGQCEPRDKHGVQTSDGIATEDNVR